MFAGPTWQEQSGSFLWESLRHWCQLHRELCAHALLLLGFPPPPKQARQSALVEPSCDSAMRPLLCFQGLAPIAMSGRVVLTMCACRHESWMSGSKFLCGGFLVALIGFSGVAPLVKLGWRGY